MDLDWDLLGYVAVLTLSGLMLLVLFALGIGSRAINGIVGLLALGYGGYILYEYFLTSDEFTVRRFIYAYALPLVAIYQLYTGLKQRRERRAAAANQLANQFTLPPAQPETPQS